MFNKHTDTRVETLICGELRTAKEQHGEKFNSLHEAYAVALEELEEASESVDTCKFCYKKNMGLYQMGRKRKQTCRTFERSKKIHSRSNKRTCTVCGYG